MIEDAIAYKIKIFEKKEQNVFLFDRKVINLQPKASKSDKMRNLGAYFYLYFYFASNCEAGSCA